MEEQETKLAEFRMEQEAIKKRAADRHAKENGLREEQIKRLQVWNSNRGVNDCLQWCSIHHCI